jgi:hypothetical protein
MTQRSPAIMFLIACTGIGALWWYFVTSDELNKKFNTQLPPAWHIIIPILNIIWAYKFWNGVQKVTGFSWIVGFLLGPIGVFLAQGKLNTAGQGGAGMQRAA